MTLLHQWQALHYQSFHLRFIHPRTRRMQSRLLKIRIDSTVIAAALTTKSLKWSAATPPIVPTSGSTLSALASQRHRKAPTIVQSAGSGQSTELCLMSPFSTRSRHLSRLFRHSCSFSLSRNVNIILGSYTHLYRRKRLKNDLGFFFFSFGRVVNYTKKKQFWNTRLS